MNTKLSRYERDEYGYGLINNGKIACLPPKILLCTQETSSNQDLSATQDNGGIDAVVFAGNSLSTRKSTKTQLKHALGVNHSNLSDLEIREAADYIGLKSQVTKVKPNELDTLPLPVLIEIDNSWKVLTKSADGSSLLYDPATQLEQQSELSLE